MARTRKNFRVLLILGMVLGMLADDTAGEERCRFERQLMGTRFMVVCHASDKVSAERAVEVAFALAEQVNAVASDYLPESELSQLSSKPVNVPIPLSPMLFEVLAHARRLAEETGGAYDPTLGPLTQLWRESRQSGRLPAPAKLQEALARSGWQHFTLDPGKQTITLHRTAMVFDLGGVAKGHAADLMLASLAKNGIPRAMVAAGGDIRLGDPPPDRDGWRIALQTFDLARPDEVVLLKNTAVSTSGDLHQWVEIEGVRYSHILSPRTGLGLTRRMAAIVIASDARLSDALATAACVLGPEAGEMLRRIPGVRQVMWRTPQESQTLVRENPPAKFRLPHEKQP